MGDRRFLNPSQPQTLQIAVMLLYINGVFAALTFLLNPALGALYVLMTLGMAAGSIAGGYGIANELRWGYALGVAMAFLPLVVRVAILGPGGLLGVGVISLLFEIALIALLLHPQSRNYQRIWFR